MRMSRMLALGASVLVLAGACSTGGGGTTSASAGASAASSAAPSGSSAGGQGAPVLKVGSDGFNEAKVMAEIYGQALEAKGYTIDRTGIGIGTRKVSAAALDSGQIQFKPEYLGGGTAFYAAGKQTSDPAATAQALQEALTAKGITVLTYTPGSDYDAFVVRKDTADQFHLTKMSDLTAVASQLKFGVATDCPTNPVCAKALKDAYGIDVSNATKLSACDAPMVQALQGKTIDVAELCSTQGVISANGWVLLDDDKKTQPAQNIAPLVRNDYLSQLSDAEGFKKILNDVSAAVDIPTLTDLNKQIDVDKKDITAVAKAWLQSKGFVS